MIKLAVNTVTFRSYSPVETLQFIARANVSAVEWAGDVHSPPGDPETAIAIKEASLAQGIEITSYGSYYQCDDFGSATKGPFAFDLGAQAAFDSALALGVQDIRVWAGRNASSTATPAYRSVVAKRLSEFCDLAANLGIRVHLEFHRNTLADTAESAINLLATISKDNLYCYWQPRHTASVEENLSDIKTLGERISNIHVFHWIPLKSDPSSLDRRPLIEGKHRWLQYFEELKKLSGEHYAMIEFVRNDSLSQFYDDAKTLREIVASP